MVAALYKVAHVSLSLDMGGMEKLLVEFARHADRKRFNLHFFCLKRRGDLAGEVEALGWPVESLDKRPGLRPALALRLARRLRDLGIDVVHTHNPPACIYGVPAARLARVPAALNTRHGQGARPGTRQARLLTWSVRLAHRVVCVSRDSADVAVQYGIPHERVTTILNGIDLERFAYRGPCIGGPAILVARLAPEKDIATLVRAVAIVAARVANFRLRLVGDGPSRPAIAALARELGVEDRVETVGQASDIPDQLARASMFVLSSLTEGISVSLLEAMAVGLPTVATRVGGNTEVVIDGQTGLLVPPQDPEALAGAMIRIATNPELAQEFGRAGRARVETQFDVRAMVGAYERLYMDLLGVHCVEAGRE